jgi:2-polyprenyl-6-methoxyphenol hydroxylase-like FAD-dependent oxidoreductase
MSYSVSSLFHSHLRGVLPSWLVSSEQDWEAIYESRIAHLISQRDKHQRSDKASVVILGGGPAGLARAIESIRQGHFTQIFEKRSEGQEGRYHSVRVDSRAFQHLDDIGVLAYLHKEGLIYPEHGQKMFNARLVDIERAMKAVLERLAPQAHPIEYGRYVEQIHYNGAGQAVLEMVDKNGNREHLEKPADVLVIAEGSHSSTAKILGFQKSQVLPQVHVVTALFQDPETGSWLSFFYAQCRDFKNKMYYFLQFLKEVCQGENLLNPRRKIVASLLLGTPGQNYLGFMFTKDMQSEISSLQSDIEQLEREKQRLAKEDPSAERFFQIETQKKAKQEELDEKLIYWCHMAFFFANTLQIIQFVMGGQSFGEMCRQFCRWRPLRKDRISVIKIGVNKLDHYAEQIKNTSVLVCGDAAATFDPASGNGLNIALHSVYLFQRFLAGLNIEGDKDLLHRHYCERMDELVRIGHAENAGIRNVLDYERPFIFQDVLA